MFCKYCGNKLPEKANFCPECGRINEEPAAKEEKPLTEEQVFFSAPTDYYTPSEPTDDIFEAEKDSLGGKILTFSILGLAFGMSGCLSLLGLIFSIIARAKLGTYVAKFNETQGRATVGKHLSIAALIVSICFTVFFILYFIIVFLAALAGAGMY